MAVLPGMRIYFNHEPFIIMLSRFKAKQTSKTIQIYEKKHDFTYFLL